MLVPAFDALAAQSFSNGLGSFEAGERELEYRFYGCTGLALVTGMTNLRGVSRMEHAFDACFAPAELDLRCMGPSALVILTHTFGARTARPRSWPMPTGAAQGMRGLGHVLQLQGSCGRQRHCSTQS